MLFLGSGVFTGLSLVDFFIKLKNWDAGHYLGIAEFGYSVNYQYAFFPLYPLLIRAINFIVGDFLFSGLLISILSSLVGLIFFTKLIILDFGEKKVLPVLPYLLFFPTSFYLLIAYSEGLFFCLTTSSFYYLRLYQKNSEYKNLALSVLFAALTAATRPFGAVLGLVIIFSLLDKKRFKTKELISFFSFTGLIIYMVYLYIFTGDPIYFLTAQGNWKRYLVFPGSGIWNALNNLFDKNFSLNFEQLVNIVFTVFGVGFVIRLKRFLPVPYFLFGLLSVLLPLSTSNLMSMPRFLLTIFPIFIIISAIKNKLFQTTYVAISLSLLILFSCLYINRYWIS